MEEFTPPAQDGVWGNAQKSAQELFEEEAWERAYLEHDGLRIERMWETCLSNRVLNSIRAAWAAMDDAGRRVYEDMARARAAYKASYVATQVKAAAWHAPLLTTLLRRSPNVWTLNLSSTNAREYSSGPPRLRLKSSDGMLRQIGASWGASLRICRLGNAQLAPADVHALLAACPQLAQLHVGAVKLKGAPDALFGDGMAPHQSLRSVAVPPPAAHLLLYVTRLCDRCPALRELDAESFDASSRFDEFGYDEVSEDEAEHGGGDLLVRSARLAASRGVQRFLCTSFFAGGGSDGEYGSDGGSVGEYVGDGNVLKHIL
jgi:hypothetical protein